MKLIRDKQAPMPAPSGPPRRDGTAQGRLHGVGARSEAWFQRQLAHAKACIAEADKRHTEQEVADAWASLADDPRSRQNHLDLRNA